MVYVGHRSIGQTGIQASGGALSTKSTHAVHARRFIRSTIGKMVDRTATEADYRILFVVLRDFMNPESYLGKWLNASAHIKELNRDSSVPPVYHQRMIDCSFIMGARARHFSELDKRFGNDVRERYNERYGFGTFELKYYLDNNSGKWMLLEGCEPPIAAIANLYGSISVEPMSRVDIRHELNSAIVATQAGVDIMGEGWDHVARDLCVALAGSLHGMRMRCLLGQSMHFVMYLQDASEEILKSSARQACPELSEEELNDRYDERVVMTHYMRATNPEDEVTDTGLARIQNMFIQLFNTGLSPSEVFLRETDSCNEGGAISQGDSFRMVRSQCGELRLAIDRREA